MKMMMRCTAELLKMPPANVEIFLEKLWSQSYQGMHTLGHCRRRHKFSSEYPGRSYPIEEIPGFAPLASAPSPSVLSVKLNLIVTGDWWITASIPAEYQHLL